MPELPEVETVVQELISAKIVGQTIASIEIFWPKTVHPAPEEFAKLLKNKQILGIKRRGKYIVLSLSGDLTLFIHLRMTGRFTFTPPHHARASLHFADGRTLYYNDPRKFGRWTLLRDTSAMEEKLGLEPLEEAFTVEALKKVVRTRSRQIKPLLLDQKLIAGLGNIYVDEALWYAKIHPQTVSSTLTDGEIKRLHGAIQHVLQKGLETKGTTLGNGKSNFYRVDGSRGSHQEVLYVFRRNRLPCPRCKTAIERIVVAQRSSHFCPACQVVRAV
jgi:formamidopyrimidine-DNA glycosylase